MKTSTGVETHPIEDIYFFEPLFSAGELNNKKLRVKCEHQGISYDQIFIIFAWPHPRVPNLIGMKARCEYWGATIPSTWTLVFDSTRGSKVAKASHPDYDFEADLGALQIVQQSPHVWETVRADFDLEVKAIGPIPEVS